MKKTNVIILLFVATLIICLGNVPVFGYSTALQDQGINTFDSETNLLWLDMLETEGMSYNEVMASDYVISGGYRLATADEMGDYYAKWEMPDGRSHEMDDWQKYVDLHELVGASVSRVITRESSNMIWTTTVWATMAWGAPSADDEEGESGESGLIFLRAEKDTWVAGEIGRASCRERV